MCKRPAMTFDPAARLSGGFKRQTILVDLVGTIERVAHDMLNHAADANSPTNKAKEQSKDGGAKGLSVPNNVATPAPFIAPMAEAGAAAAAALQETKMPALPHAFHRPEVGMEEHHNDEADKEGPKRKKRKRRNSSAKLKDPDSTEKGHKRSYVEHHYHDHSKDLPGDEGEVQQSAKSRGGITTPFPMQLHDMLQHAESRGYSDVVSWQPHGRAFHVHDSTRFVAEVMPLFFRQTRMSSFQRQLSLYGFLRLTRKGTDHGAYYHELFLRGMPHLCHRMQRTRIKGYWVRQSSSPETEPDFSEMSVVGQPGEPASGAAFAKSASGRPMPAQAGGGLAFTVMPPAMMDSNPFWNFPSLSDATSTQTKANPSSLQVDQTLGATSTGVPALLRQNKVKVPPMPPLGLALPATASDTTTTIGMADLKQPALSSESMLQPPGLLMASSQQQQQHLVLPPPPAQALQGAADAALHEASASLDAHFGETMNAADRDDLVAFLSDVDLTSGDENSVEESFEEEAKIGRVASDRKRRTAGV